MILLSLTTAAKYILSLMLAILGFIPFEEVRPPERDRADMENVFHARETAPLAMMTQKASFGTEFFSPAESMEHKPAIVSPRNNFPLNFRFLEKQQVYTVHYQTAYEGLQLDKALKQKLVILCKDALTTAQQEIIFVQSGI